MSISDSPRSLPSTSSSSHIVLHIEEPEFKAQNSSPTGKLSRERNVAMRIISPPATPEAALEIVKIAEIATMEGNFKHLEICDLALRVFYSNRKHCKDLLQINSNGPIPIGVSAIAMRIARLNLPHTKGEIIQQCIHEQGAEWIIIDDRSSNFANLLEGRLSDLLIDRMNVRVLGTMTEEERSANNVIFKNIAESLIREREAQNKILDSLEISRRFALFLYCLKNSSYQVAIEPIFFNLVETVLEGTLSTLQCQDLIQLSKLHPDLVSLLGKGRDKVWIRVLDREKNEQVNLEASRLLLGGCCEYFQELVKQGSLREYRETSDGSRELDLSKSHFDKKIIVVLLRWLLNAQVVSFSIEGEKRELNLLNLELILTHFSALNVYNHAEFLEKIQMEMIDLITEDILVDILKLSLRFKLQIVEAACIEYINEHPSGSYSIIRRPDNSFNLVKHATEAPLILQQAVGVLAGKIAKGLLVQEKQKLRDRSKKGCLTRTTYVVGRLWKIFGGFIKRTAVFSGAIVGIQSVSHIPLWSAGKTIGVASGVSVGYGVISLIFERCIVARVMRRYHIPVIGCQKLARTKLRCINRVSTCFKRCYTCCNSSHSPKPLLDGYSLPTFPKPLLQIDLSKAKYLTDSDIEKLVRENPQLQQLTLGGNSLLTATGYSHLSTLSELNQLRIYIEDSQPAEGLHHLNLQEIFGNRRDFRVELDVSDSTISCFPLPFLKFFPRNSEVYIQLRHVPMPRELTIEARRNAGRLQLWPDTIRNLVLTCNHVTYLDLNLSFVCTPEDLELISMHCSSLRSLKIHFSDLITDDAIAGLVRCCRQLEKVYFQGGSLTDRSIEMVVGECLELIDMTLIHCSRLTNRSLEHLSKAPKLHSCKIMELSEIDDAGVTHLLNRKAPWNNLEVDRCERVSDHLLVTLAKLPSLAHKKAIEHINAHYHCIRATPIPTLQLRSLPSLIFQFLIDNFNKRNRSNNTPPNEFLVNLGVESHPHFKLRASIIQALASVQWHSKFFPIGVFDDEYRKKIKDIMEYVVEYGLSTVLPELLPKSITAYFTFLKDYFSDEFREQVNVLINSTLENSKNGVPLERLQLFMPLIYSKNRIRLIRDGQMWLGDNSPIRPLITTWAKAVGQEGNRLSWNEEQRCAAFLGITLIHLDWIRTSLITHIKPLEELTIGAEDSKRTELKEEKTESKNEKQDQD